MKKKIISALCAFSTIFTTPGLVTAGPPRPDFAMQSQGPISDEVVSTNHEQNNQNFEKNQIENLANDLIKSYDGENSEESLKTSSYIIKKLSEMENFHEQEAIIAQAIAVAAKKRCFDEIGGDYDVKIKNILKRCSIKSCARKYVACAIGRLIIRKFFNNVYDENGEEIKNILLECSKSCDAKLNVASAVKEWIDAQICDSYALNNMTSIINLLSNCSGDNDALQKISNAIYCLTNKNNSIDQKNLYDILKLLSLCINNDDYSTFYGAKTIDMLLTKNNFLELMKKDEKIKKDIVDLMRVCWSANIENSSTHCIINKIFSDNPQNLFSMQDIQAVKNTELKKWNFDVKKCCAYSNMEADDIFIDEKNVCKNIIDQNSEDEKNKSRNEIRKFMNSVFLEHISFIAPAMPSICVQYTTNYGWKRNQAISKVENKFDRFLYEKISNWIKEIFQNQKKSGLDEKNCGKEFDFLETKITLADKLISQEKDLIKQLILKIMCKNIQNFSHRLNPSVLKCDDPYDCKIQAEELYFDWIKKYHASYNIKYNMDGCLIKQKAHLAALEDAKNNKIRSDFIGENENFISAYMQTYALATAELDAKRNLGRNHKFPNNSNIQNIYDLQYEKIVKNIGAHDGKKIKSRYIYNGDSKAQEIYDSAYLNSVEDIAKCDLNSQNDNYYDRLEMFEWNEAKKTYKQTFTNELCANLLEDVKDDIAQVEINIPEKMDIPDDNVKIYMDMYLNNMFKLGFDEFYVNDFPMFEINKKSWKNLLVHDIYDNQELTDFKSRLKKSYIEGCKSGSKVRGYCRGFYNDNKYSLKNSDNVILRRLYYRGYSEGIADREDALKSD